MAFSIVLIALGLLGIVGGIWLVLSKRASSVVMGLVIMVLSLIPLGLGLLLMSWPGVPA